MNLEVGEVLEGKVTGITKFGAFVQLPGGGSGLVHISEIANAFVNDVNDYLTVGDTVKVKVIGINGAGKINLSIKQLQAAQPAQPARSPRPTQARRSNPGPRDSGASAHPSARSAHTEIPTGEVLGPSNDASFEDKLKHFMQISDSKVSGNKLYGERRGNNRRRK